MRYKLVFSLILAVALISLGVFAPAGHSQEGPKVVVKGSTTVLPITLKAIEAYKKIMPKVSISVEGSGSGNGIKSLLEGSCDLANSSRAMKKEELDKAGAAKIKVKEIVVAYDMIVPVVHPSNRVANLTKEQLKGIYDGSINNWKVVGGEDMKIVVISRDTSSGTYEYWHEDVLKKTDTRKDALLQASNGAIVNAVSNNKKAIGYIGFGYLNDSVKALKVNSVTATIENGKSKKYPISRELFMYTNAKTMSKETKDFVNYLLGKDGQALVKKAGFIPLK